MTQKVDGLPEALAVGPLVFDVQPTTTVGDEDLDEWGRTEFRERVVLIDTRLPLYERRVSFFHEWGHLILRRSGLEHVLTDDQQELFCDLVAFGLADLVEDGTLSLNEARSQP